MKIGKMTARFGALDGRTLELSDGLNILYAPNESGKSTWCAFLRTMLYGLDTSQRPRAGQKPDKVKYRPWSGAPMSGSMELDTEAGPVTIRRWTERENQPMQAFSATVTGTDTPAPGLTAETAGERLTGMTRPVFERSVFIRQAGMELQNDPELDRRISAIVSSGDEEVSYLEADKRLKSWQRRRRSGKRGAIPQLQEEMDRTRQTLAELDRHGQTVSEAEEELAALAERRADTEARMVRARAELRKKTLAELGAARQAVKKAESLRENAARALSRAEEALDGTPFGRMGPEEASKRSEKDVSAAEELLRLAEKLPGVGISFIPLALAALAFVLAFFLPWRTECAAVGCILILLFVVMFTRLQGLQRTKADTLADRERILTAYGVSDPAEIPPLVEEYRDLWRTKDRAAFRLETAEAALSSERAAQKRAEARAVNDLDFAAGDNEAVRASKELEALEVRASELRERRAMAEGEAKALGDRMVLESGLARQERRYGELLRQEEAMTLAEEIMTQADGELQQRLSPRLARKAAEYFSALTGGRYDEVTFTRDLTARARLTGDAVGWELDYLSAGTRDQLYLALRLALCDLALGDGEDPCPLILDDALVAFDGERMARALRLIRTIADKRQVLLFTCHEREGAFFAEDPAVTRRTIA